MAVTASRRLNRPEYWTRIGLLYGAFFVFGMMSVDTPDALFESQIDTLSLLAWPLQVWWGVGRCRDAGWNPLWAVLNFNIFANIVFGIPGSKFELRLEP